MEALRLSFYQQTACFRKPLALKVRETYPLPPYSTVKGLVHALLRADRLIPLQFSIQGTYEALVQDYQTHVFFKQRDVSEYALTTAGLDAQPDTPHITRMPLYTQLLFDLHLTLHVAAAPSILDALEQAVSDPDEFLSLGRREDLVRLDECRRVRVGAVPPEETIVLPQDAYIPEALLPPDVGRIPMQLNWTYTVKDSVREWTKVPVGYVQAGSCLKGPGLRRDDAGCPVFFWPL